MRPYRPISSGLRRSAWLRSTDDRIAAHVRLMHDELLQWAGSNDELRANVSAVRAERDELAQGMSSAAHERDRMETRAL